MGARTLALWNFYPRPPRGGRLVSVVSVISIESISIHALREEGDEIPPRRSIPQGYFYPRPPRGGRRKMPASSDFSALFLSTPSARRATVRHRYYQRRECISIHALREEGDSSAGKLLPGGKRFLSTPSARRATLEWWRDGFGAAHFYPRPPRGGRRRRCWAVSTERAISIHALREEGDRSTMPLRFVPCNFYPRPPRGGRPQGQRSSYRGHQISIHALREEGDQCLLSCSARPKKFLSTPSARRATDRPGCGHQVWRISIHALREEGDTRAAATGSTEPISIHALREEGDKLVLPIIYTSSNFYPRPPRGGRRAIRRALATR